MSASFLCVQFRNLLPSEELLLFARALWADLQLRANLSMAGDANLAITQNGSDQPGFQVELTIEGSAFRSSAYDRDALAAVQDAFEQLGAYGPLSESSELGGVLELGGETPRVSETATPCRAQDLA
jgi:hypothetical protein